MAALDEICLFVNTDSREEVPLRSALRELLRANNSLEGDVDAACRELDCVGLEVGFADGGLIFTAPHPIVAAVAETMVRGQWRRLKACRSDECQRAFVDRSRNLSRRWCDMTSCGNRAKARNARQRRAASYSNYASRDKHREWRSAAHGQ